MAKQTRVINYENFDLIKFKIDDNGVDVTHFETGSALPGNDFKQGEVQAHPDLIDKLSKLKIYVAEKIGLLEVIDAVLDTGTKDPKVIEEVRRLRELILTRIKVNGFSFEGSGELEGVNIKIYYKFPKKGGTGLASGKIHFNSNELGYEQEVEEICQEVKKEVFAYRFQNKKAQLDIVTESKKVNEEPELPL